MHDLLILGTGRSGTSMVAGLFRSSGAFLGDSLIPPKRANPYGYFEDPQINGLNTRIIHGMIDALWTTRLWPRRVHPIQRHEGGSWLAAPWYLPRVALPADVRSSMRAKLRRRPFCLKDPRFCVTLPVWRPLLPEDVRFLVVFRDPFRTVASILRDAVETYRPALPIDEHFAYVHWRRNYRRLLDVFARSGDWLFVHYDDVLSGTALPAIENFAAAHLDATQLDPAVSRTRTLSRRDARRVPDCCRRLYERLCRRAARDLRRWSAPTDACAAGAPAPAQRPAGVSPTALSGASR